eukprot:g560.t1
MPEELFRFTLVDEELAAPEHDAQIFDEKKGPRRVYGTDESPPKVQGAVVAPPKAWEKSAGERLVRSLKNEQKRRKLALERWDAICDEDEKYLQDEIERAKRDAEMETKIRDSRRARLGVAADAEGEKSEGCETENAKERGEKGRDKMSDRQSPEEERAPEGDEPDESGAPAADPDVKAEEEAAPSVPADAGAEAEQEGQDHEPGTKAKATEGEHQTEDADGGGADENEVPQEIKQGGAAAETENPTEEGDAVETHERRAEGAGQHGGTDDSKTNTGGVGTGIRTESDAMLAREPSDAAATGAPAEAPSPPTRPKASFTAAMFVPAIVFPDQAFEADFLPMAAKLGLASTRELEGRESLFWEVRVKKEDEGRWMHVGDCAADVVSAAGVVDELMRWMFNYALVGARQNDLPSFDAVPLPECYYAARSCQETRAKLVPPLADN